MVSANEVETVPIGPALETAIQRSPMLYIRNGYAYRFKSFHRDAIMTRWIFPLDVSVSFRRGLVGFESCCVLSRLEVSSACDKYVNDNFQ